MIMGWFLPLGVLIAALGTRTAWRNRGAHPGPRRDPAWWLLLVLAWLPMLCWILAQITVQD